jgi:adenylosuccinate synthase
MCTAPQLAADAGLPGVNTCWMVIRTYPIRVAGNSGPFKNETTWDAVSKRCGRTIIEKTTVTKKVRRVGLFDQHMVDEAAYVNGADFIVLNFADYLHPDMANVTEWGQIPESIQFHLLELDRSTNARLTFIGTGFSEETGWTYAKAPQFEFPGL